MASIDDVRSFWDAHPLWTGESRYQPGTREFFEEHRATYINDCHAGCLDSRFFPGTREKLLDVGCGIGFWPVEFSLRGYMDITGVDISPRSIGLARKRCELYGATA